MNNQIHTVPVTDAFKESRAEGGCAFCRMRGKLERDTVAFILGPAYMEDDVRMETNRAGFCGEHLKKMYGEQNRLGLALMLHTHLKRLNGEVAARKGRTGEKLEKTSSSCYVCEKVNDTFERYVETFFRLLSGGGEESALIESVSGYCVPHFALILNRAEKMGKNKAARFYEKFLPAQQAYMKAMEEDLEWFTFKFDYRNADAPWKNAKDALPRAINMLSGGYECKG